MPEAPMPMITHRNIDALFYYQRESVGVPCFNMAHNIWRRTTGRTAALRWSPYSGLKFGPLDKSWPLSTLSSPLWRQFWTDVRSKIIGSGMSAPPFLAMWPETKFWSPLNLSFLICERKTVIVLPTLFIYWSLLSLLCPGFPCIVGAQWVVPQLVSGINSWYRI